MMRPAEAIYVTYIAATPDQIWAAITSSEQSPKYFFGRHVESDWKVGSAFKLMMEDGRVDSQGKVLEADRPRRLSVTWHVEWMEEFRALPEGIVTWQLDALGDVVRLTVFEAHDETLPEKYREGGRHGWPVILSGLKTLLETGRALPKFTFPG
jgi:uncharacterized protein YndB with AHSA1/START domain